MDRDLDGYIERCIQEIFGVTPEERNVILFDCGGRLAARLRTLGVPIVEDWIFWSKFRELFGNDFGITHSREFIFHSHTKVGGFKRLPSI